MPAINKVWDLYDPAVWGIVGYNSFNVLQQSSVPVWSLFLNLDEL
jgi:hypothetical protein